MNLAVEAQPVEQSPKPPFQLRGGSYTMIVLRLIEPKHPAFYKLLTEKISQAPGFFTDAPVVLDLQDLAYEPPFNMAELRRRLRQHRLMAFGVQNGTDEQNKIAENAGMVVLPEGRQAAMRPTAARPPDAEAKAEDGAAPAAAEPAPAPAEPQAAPGGTAETASSVGEEQHPQAVPSKVVIHPVRSGRQIYAQGGDLIVLASISPGAELIADGHIHVYGALRGRALAGIAGNPQARIFCRSLEAELVSVAGYWRVRDDIPEELIGKPVQIYLGNEQVVIEELA
ncbi:MAG: septum site-determining protein MinC [Rhodospirillales bacterium]|jgi:septum site-determining protein MinC|nr:septum site-determining protein MinC [Rhodospirillales bacterium]